MVIKVKNEIEKPTSTHSIEHLEEQLCLRVFIEIQQITITGWSSSQNADSGWRCTCHDTNDPRFVGIG